LDLTREAQVSRVFLRLFMLPDSWLSVPGFLLQYGNRRHAGSDPAAVSKAGKVLIICPSRNIN